MAEIIMLYGQSGTGKSTSLRNFKKEEVAVVNVSSKRMPFRNDLQVFNCNDYATIGNAISKASAKTIVIDDATYLMVDAFMRNAKVTGYQKFTDMALDFNNLIELARKLPDDKIVYFIGHSEQMEDGREHFKTIGKMLDNYVTLEGKFTIVLKSVVKDNQYYFSTHNNGQDTVKSPMGMFEEDLIPNDLKMVDDTIREFWNMPKNESKEKEKK